MSSNRVVDLRNRGARTASQSTPSLRFPDKKQRTPLRERRRRIRFFIVLFLLVLIVGFAWGISYVSYLPRFSVSTVSVVGTQNVPASLVQTYAETQIYDGTHPFISRNNIFLFNAGRLGREIVGYFPRIASADVSRASVFATAVTVTVTEREPYAQWCDDSNDCYFLDNTGFIFAQAPALSTSTPSSAATSYVFEGGVATSSDATSSPQTSPIGQSFAPSHFPGILALLQLLSQAGFSPQGATVASDEDFSVPLSEGFYIKASFGEDTSLLMSNLQLVLSSDALQGQESNLEYVDLRFGDKVYYKLKGQDEVTAPSS